MSLKTLIYVKNWCNYKNNQVNILISVLFLQFLQYLCQFWLIITILDLFWRVSYKKPILIILDQFIKTGLEEKQPDHSPVQSLCGLFAVSGLDFQELTNSEQK